MKGYWTVHLRGKQRQRRALLSQLDDFFSMPSKLLANRNCFFSSHTGMIFITVLSVRWHSNAFWTGQFPRKLSKYKMFFYFFVFFCLKFNVRCFYCLYWLFFFLRSNCDKNINAVHVKKTSTLLLIVQITVQYWELSLNLVLRGSVTSRWCVFHSIRHTGRLIEFSGILFEIVSVYFHNDES